MTLLIGDGPSFTFHALAEDSTQAYDLLQRAWLKHCEQVRIVAEMGDVLSLQWVENIEPGMVFRDFSRFV